MSGLLGLVPDMQDRPGEEQGDQDNNGASKQENEQVAKFSSGLALDLART
jgi:hypothetical protein